MCFLCKKTFINPLLYLNKAGLKFIIIVRFSIPKLDFLFCLTLRKKREGMNEYVEKEKKFGGIINKCG